MLGQKNVIRQNEKDRNVVSCKVRAWHDSELEVFVVEACLDGSQDVVDIPCTWPLLQFVGIIVLFKVWKQDCSPLQHCDTVNISMKTKQYSAASMLVCFEIKMQLRIFAR